MRVTVIIPARNEARFIGDCVRSVCEQDWSGPIEVLVIDGRSTDHTRGLAEAAGARVLDNPELVIPCAMNVGLAQANGDIVVRFDAHAKMPPGYIRRCVATLQEEPDAGNVGGWRRVASPGPWGRAIAAALASPLGVGNARIWRRPTAAARRRDVESVPLGCFDIAALRAAGGWDPTLHANEDYELNHRLRELGWRVIWDPNIWSTYYPRESLPDLCRQYRGYGKAKATVLRRYPRSLRPRQVAPLLVVAVFVAAAVPNPVRRLALAALIGYGGVIGGEAYRCGEGWRICVLLPAMHLSWGVGVLEGFASGTGCASKSC